MTSIPTKSHVAYRPDDRSSTLPDSVGQKICLVAGLTCLAGFLVDTMTLSSPISPLVIEWRISFLQLMGDRSVVLFFAVALLLYSTYNTHRTRRLLAFTSLVIGVAFLMACVLVIRDSLIVRDETVQNISIQAQQVQTRIEATQDNETFSSRVTPEQIEQASQRLSIQADTLKENARKGIIQSGIASVGNLMVVGIGLIGLSRLGFVRSR